MPASPAIYSKLHSTSVEISYPSAPSDFDDLSSACTLLHSDSPYDLQPGEGNLIIESVSLTSSNVASLRITINVGSGVRIISGTCVEENNGGESACFMDMDGFSTIKFVRCLFDPSRNEITPTAMDDRNFIFTLWYKTTEEV